MAALLAVAFPSAIAPHLPALHWVIDLAACFPVQAAVALALGAIVLFCSRRRRLAALYCLGALSALVAVAAGWLAAAEARPQGEHRLAVLTMNLSRGNEANAAFALDEIRRTDADVVFLSEVTPAWHLALESGLAAWPHRALRVDAGYFGVWLLSKAPLREAEVIPLSVAWAPAVRAIVESDGGDVGVLAVHTPRPGRRHRCAERDAALAAIAAATAPLPERRCVLGDFNATPWNRSFAAMLDAAALRRAGAIGFRPTWPVQLPWPLRVPIDHVLVGGDLGVEAVEVGPGFGSDHAPLAATLRF